MAAAKHKPSRTVFLSDPEIRELEQMDSGQISAHFMHLGVDKASQLVRSMIASYRITARVANAAWGLAVAMNKHGIPVHPEILEELTKLQAALSDYSPGNWPPVRTEREYAVHVLEKLYEEAARMPAWESSLEKIYETLSREYDEVNKP